MCEHQLQWMYLHDQLVCTADQLELVGMIKHFRHIMTKGVASSTRRDAPAGTIVGVRPQQVAHWSLNKHHHCTPASQSLREI